MILWFNSWLKYKIPHWEEKTVEILEQLDQNQSAKNNAAGF